MRLWNQSLRLTFVLPAILLSIAACCVFVSPAAGCPFCSAPSLTLTEQLAATQSAVLVQWVQGQEANREKGFAGTTDYEVVQIAHDESKTLKPGEILTLARFRAAAPGDLFLLLGTQIEDRIDWSSPLEVTETSYNYIVQAPSKETRSFDRLTYFLKFLEYPDPLIATDAYSEFANAPYEEIVPLANQMSPAKLREWLSNPQLTPTRLGLYGLMLGLCGQPEDAEFLKSKILEETEDFRLGVDGMMAGYLILTGDRGLDVLNEAKLSNPKVPFSETFAAMQALRFMWTNGNGRIAPEEMRASMRLLLERPNLADLVIVDLARWNDWGVMDSLMSMYNKSEYDVPAIKRAIVRFMLIAERVPAGTAGEGPVPDYVIAAKQNLAHLREVDPKTVSAAERYFFD